MSRESCIVHPPNSRFVMIREDYLALTDGNACAAALLHDLEQWHNAKLRGREQAAEHNRAARQSDMDGDQDTELWIYKSQAEFKAELIDNWSERTIAAALQLLYDKGFIETRNNPHYKWDRTMQFLFNDAAVQLALYQSTGYGPAQIDILQKRRMDDAKSKHGFGKKAEAIPEITSEITSDHTKSLAGQKAPAPEKAQSKRTKLGIPEPDQNVLDAFCVFLYGDLGGWKLNYWRIQRLYNEIYTKFAPPTIEDLRRVYLWWTEQDYRGKKGEHPTPAQLVEYWSVGIGYKGKGKFNDKQTEKQLLGQQSGNGRDWGFKPAQAKKPLP